MSKLEAGLSAHSTNYTQFPAEEGDGCSASIELQLLEASSTQRPKQAGVTGTLEEEGGMDIKQCEASLAACKEGAGAAMTSLTADPEMADLEGKLKLVTAQRQLSALRCQSFLNDLENYVCTTAAHHRRTKSLTRAPAAPPKPSHVRRASLTIQGDPPQPPAASPRNRQKSANSRGTPLPSPRPPLPPSPREDAARLAWRRQQRARSFAAGFHSCGGDLGADLCLPPLDFSSALTEEAPHHNRPGKSSSTRSSPVSSAFSPTLHQRKTVRQQRGGPSPRAAPPSAFRSGCASAQELVRHRAESLRIGQRLGRHSVDWTESMPALVAAQWDGADASLPEVNDTVLSRRAAGMERCESLREHSSSNPTGSPSPPRSPFSRALPFLGTPVGGSLQERRRQSSNNSIALTQIGTSGNSGRSWLSTNVYLSFLELNAGDGCSQGEEVSSKLSSKGPGFSAHLGRDGFQAGAECHLGSLSDEEEYRDLRFQSAPLMANTSPPLLRFATVLEQHISSPSSTEASTSESEV